VKIAELTITPHVGGYHESVVRAERELPSLAIIGARDPSRNPTKN